MQTQNDSNKSYFKHYKSDDGGIEFYKKRKLNWTTPTYQAFL